MTQLTIFPTTRPHPHPAKYSVGMMAKASEWLPPRERLLRGVLFGRLDHTSGHCCCGP